MVSRVRHQVGGTQPKREPTMKAKKACLFVLSYFLITACAIGAEPCGTAAWINGEGSLRVRQFSDGEICAYFQDQQNARNPPTTPTREELLSGLRDVISAGNDIIDRGSYDGTLDFVVRDPFGGDLSIRVDAVRLLMIAEEDGGFASVYAGDTFYPPMKMGGDLEAALARQENGESLTLGQEVSILVYRISNQIVDVASSPIPDLQIHEATGHPEQDGYSVRFEGKTIWATGSSATARN